jgi:hypothetical protein
MRTGSRNEGPTARPEGKMRPGFHCSGAISVRASPRIDVLGRLPGMVTMSGPSACGVRLNSAAASAARNFHGGGSHTAPNPTPRKGVTAIVLPIRLRRYCVFRTKNNSGRRLAGRP